MYEDAVLYILPRKDMDSLNHAGKMGAQIAHAANHAVWAIGKATFGAEHMQALKAWEDSTPQGFGTVIVLGDVVDPRRLRRGNYNDGNDAIKPLTLTDIQTITDEARKKGFASGIVNDPSYPLTDGKVTHGFPCDTCGWIFGSKAGLEILLKNYKLHEGDAVPKSR